MQELQSEKLIELNVPAQKNMMLVIRLTTVGVITRAGLTVDRFDDAKMAVEEACSCLLEAAEAPKYLRLTFVKENDALLIRICTDCSCSSPENDELTVVRCILESLADTVKMCQCDGRLTGIELRIATCA